MRKKASVKGWRKSKKEEFGWHRNFFESSKSSMGSAIANSL